MPLMWRMYIDEQRTDRMKTLTAFYFSGTGNTRYVCDHLVSSMDRSSWKTQSRSIVGLTGKDRDQFLTDSDVIVLAYPIYGSDMPENMRNFIWNLPEGKGTQVAVLCTQMLFSGDGASILFRTLKKKGYVQRWSWQVNMPNNLCIKGSPLKQSADYEVHEKTKLAAARTKIDRIVRDIEQNRRRIGDHSILHFLLGMTQRPASRLFMTSSFQNGLDVDPLKCVSCGKCVRNCPEQTISMDNERIEFIDRDRCLTCFRCLNFCPASAITYRGAVKEPLYKGPTRELYRELFR